MIRSDETKYRRGENPALDKKFELFKKVNLFTGDAYHAALSPKEAKSLIKLWSKAKHIPWKLNLQDVKDLINFMEQILTWRTNRKRELTRLRVEKARDKVKKAANKGNRAAQAKLKAIKRANALRTADYRKKARKVRGKTAKC